MDKNLKKFVEVVQSVLHPEQRKEIMFKANVAQRTMYTYFKKLAAAGKPEPEDNRLKSILCISDNSPEFYKELRNQVWSINWNYAHFNTEKYSVLVGDLWFKDIVSTAFATVSELQWEKEYLLSENASLQQSLNNVNKALSESNENLSRKYHDIEAFKKEQSILSIRATRYQTQFFYAAVGFFLMSFATIVCLAVIFSNLK